MSETRIIVGNALERLADLPDQSVHCVVTSPPYFGLRDYGAEGQIGLEQSPDEFKEALLAVFRHVHRVLRDDGTLWLNLGDSYNAYNGNRSSHGRISGAHRGHVDRPSGFGLVDKGIKNKDLLGIPWLIAFALRADGWYLRRDIIWSKPNPMPESVTDRPTSSHEYIFLFSKQPRYFYDAKAIREPSIGGHGSGVTERGSNHQNGRSGFSTRVPWEDQGGGRNKRSVWEVAVSPFDGAHFATFPPKLIEPCILAGTSRETCAVCGAPYRTLTEQGRAPTCSHTEGGGHRYRA